MAAVTLAASAAPASSLTLHDTGRWTTPVAWPHQAVHLALLRGNQSPFHSQVIWWLGLNDETSTFTGGIWGWRPGAWSCSGTPDSSELLRLPFGTPDTTQLFCAGQTQLADGKLFVAGGTQQGAEFGIRKAYTFDPAADSANQWVQRDSMQAHRWYPTATTLADGRVLVSSGSNYEHLEFFGGLTGSDTLPTDSLLYRYGNGQNGKVDAAIGPSGSQAWPGPRTGHTMAYFGGSKTFMFGGKDQHGNLMNELWSLERLDNESGSDYSYAWTPFFPIAGAPKARWMHTALVPASPHATMILFGGIRDSLGQNVATDEVWRLWFSNPLGHYTWDQISAQNSPGPRYGHATMWHPDDRRMLMFGGSNAIGAAPTDSALWCLTFDTTYTSGTWTKLSAVGPSPRINFAAAYDPAWVDNSGPTDSSRTAAFIFGGQDANGTKRNDLWRLRLGADPTTYAQWVRDTVGGTPPSPRSGHTMTAEAGLGLYVYGGRDSSGAADSTVYFARLAPTAPGDHGQWIAYTPNSVAPTGHGAIEEPVAVFARTPEIYSPGSGTWTTLSSPHLEEWFPQTFTWKPDTVFVAGPADTSWRLSLGGVGDPGWKQYPQSSTTYKGGDAVLYRPGKVMKCGSRDTEGPHARGATSLIDLSAGSAAQWQASSDSMIGRVNHNLVLLPNGKVLVVGGTRDINNAAVSDSVLQPEIWDPDAASGLGAWSGDGVLASENYMRDYHSTAILLPDGRVLSTGGNTDTLTRHTAEIFCPPYLFNTDGTLARRPNIVGATGRWRYGFPVTVAVDSDTTIRNVCLIHAGSTTHAQDQAQRYVPLTLESSVDYGGGTRQYFLHAPADSFVAPPGDYLLFASNANGVPSVAKWTRLSAVYDGQMDTTAPDTIHITGEFVTCTAIYVSWIAPGDDHSTGTALDYDVRYSSSAITSGNFASCSELGQVPIPMLAGTVQEDSLTLIPPCTWYYFAGNVRDGAENWAALTFAGRFKTSCSGPCYLDPLLSAPLSRQRQTGTEVVGQAANGTGLARVGGFATPTALISSGSTLRLVGEFSRGEPARWQLSYQDVSADSSLLRISTTQLVVQERWASGWHLRSALNMPAGGVEVRSLARSGRVVFPAGTTLQAIEPAPQGFLCTSATQSRLGNLLTTGTALDSVSLDASQGDTLSLAFASDTSSTAGEDCFFQVQIPSAQTATRLEPKLPSPAADLPTVFALHPSRPNPFQHATTLRYDLPSGAQVKLEVFDVQGRRMATLVHSWQGAGRYVASWDGRTDGGTRASAGVYLCRMIAGSFRAERRLVLTP